MTLSGMLRSSCCNQIVWLVELLSNVKLLSKESKIKWSKTTCYTVTGRSPIYCYIDYLSIHYILNFQLLYAQSSKTVTHCVLIATQSFTDPKRWKPQLDSPQYPLKEIEHGLARLMHSFTGDRWSAVTYYGYSRPIVVLHLLPNEV